MMHMKLSRTKHDPWSEIGAVPFCNSPSFQPLRSRVLLSRQLIKPAGAYHGARSAKIPFLIPLCYLCFLLSKFSVFHPLGPRRASWAGRGFHGARSAKIPFLI